MENVTEHYRPLYIIRLLLLFIETQLVVTEYTCQINSFDLCQLIVFYCYLSLKMPLVTAV